MIPFLLEYFPPLNLPSNLFDKLFQVFSGHPSLFENAIKSTSGDFFMIWNNYSETFFELSSKKFNMTTFLRDNNKAGFL